MKVNSMVLGSAIHLTRLYGFRVDFRVNDVIVDGYSMKPDEVVTAALHLVPRHTWKSCAVWDRLQRFHPEWAKELA